MSPRRAIAAVAVALAAVAGTGGAATAQAPTPPPTLTPGVLVVGLSMPTAGFQVGIVKGRDVLQAKGFEIDLANAVAARLGVPAVRFVNEDRFTSLLTAGTKDWDVGIGQLTVTDARAQVVDFSRTYFKADQGVLLRAGRKLRSRTYTALAKLRLCAERGSTGAQVIRERVKLAKNVRLAPDLSRLEANLYQGRCDAVVADAPQLGVLRARAPDRVGTFAGRIRTDEQWAMSFPKGSALRPAVDAALQALDADGTIAGLARTWLTTDTTTLPTFR